MRITRSLRRIAWQCIRPSHVVPLVAVLGLLFLADKYIMRTLPVPAGSPVYRVDKGVRVFERAAKPGERVRIVRFDFGWYTVELPDKTWRQVPQGSIATTNRVFETFIPLVFSKNQMENQIPFKKEQVTTWYQERKNGYEIPGTNVSWRLVFPFVGVLLLVFLVALPGTILKSLAATVFFGVLALYSLYVAGNSNKPYYEYVSYFKQLSLRIPKDYQGPVWVPNGDWQVRVRAFTGFQNDVRFLSWTGPAGVRGHYVIADGASRGTPGWAWGGAGWTLVWQDGPARLFKVD